MRSKLVLAALFTLTSLPAMCQVAPAAKIGGLPLGVGGGISDYDTDYYRAYHSVLEWPDDRNIRLGRLQPFSWIGC